MPDGKDNQSDLIIKVKKNECYLVAMFNIFNLISYYKGRPSGSGGGGGSK